MAPIPPHRSSNLLLEAAQGLVAGYTTVNKFGRNSDIDTATAPEDVWDAGGLWVPPTQARIHNIASSAAADAAAGTGMRTVRIYGLVDWDTAEVSEDVTLNGVTSVATTNSYVIIHRMKGLTFGSGGINAGNITATAVTDATVTAQITANNGQTLMAIYGVPSVQNFYITQYYVDMNRLAPTAESADIQALVNERPGQSDSGFLVKHHIGVGSAGSSHITHIFIPPVRFQGPAIIKIRVENVSANDTDVSAGFDGVLIEN